MNKLVHEDASQEQCIRGFLHGFLNKTGGLHSLESILLEVGQFFEADRAYIFEFDEERLFISNTYEWCAAGINPEIDNLQKCRCPLLLCGWTALKRMGTSLSPIWKKNMTTNPFYIAF